MPSEDTKKLKFNQYQKLDKAPFTSSDIWGLLAQLGSG